MIKNVSLAYPMWPESLIWNRPVSFIQIRMPEVFENVGEAASSDKRSLFSKEIRALARIAVAGDEEPEKPDKGSGGFWRRLFGRKR